MSSDKLPPGWLEGSLRYLELYSDVMKRGPWNTEGRAVGDTGRPGLEGHPGQWQLFGVCALSRPVWHVLRPEGQDDTPAQTAV